jgi:hypothetical protein
MRAEGTKTAGEDLDGDDVGRRVVGQWGPREFVMAAVAISDDMNCHSDCGESNRGKTRD